MKKKSLFILFVLILFIKIDVYAAKNNIEQIRPDGDSDGKFVEKDEISIDNGDYEIVCIYSDGAELTITKNNTYIRNQSISANSNNGIKVFLTSEQNNSIDENGNLTKSNASKILNNGQCPARLYIYEVAAQDDENLAESEQVKGVKNFYYSTKTGIEEQIAGTHKGGFLWLSEKSNAKEKDDIIILKSEEVNITTDKNALICDYQTIGTDSVGTLGLSIYLYSNMTLVDNGERVTTIIGEYDECPGTLTYEEIMENNPDKKYIYVNNPAPVMVGNELSGNYEYPVIRFSVFGPGAGGFCPAVNDKRACVTYQFIGSRGGPTGGNDKEDLCNLLGTDTIKILKDVVSWLQIIVPALVIILTGIDITKMVLSGNLDEELPKKKKLIIVRLVVMVIFFFAPVIVGTIIRLLNETGIVYIDNLECFFK